MFTTQPDPLVITLLLVLAAWSLVWKGFALWRAAERKSKPWFIVMLVLNTAGILEIIYLFAVAPRHKA
jgi:hypothetical protein